MANWFCNCMQFYVKLDRIITTPNCFESRWTSTCQRCEPVHITTSSDFAINCKSYDLHLIHRRCFPTCMRMTLSCALLINHMSILDRAFAWPVQHLWAPLLRTSAILWIGKYQQVHCKNHFMVTSSNWSIFRVTGPLCREPPSQRPVKRSFGVFFDLRLNKHLSKHSRRWWFETPSPVLWRHCKAMAADDCVGLRFNIR